MDVAVRAGTRRSRAHERNQDRVVIGSTILGDDPRVVGDRLDGPALIAVLDGLGGHRAGDVASQLAGQHLAGAEVPKDEDGVADLFDRADRLLHEAGAAEPRYAGMGTTAALLAFGADGHEALVANVGDSTVWRLAADGIHELSVSDRAFGSTILQCLGASDRGVEPHVAGVELRRGDRILLATDGLTDVLGTDRIAAVLREGTDAADRLIDIVEHAGPPDDVAVVVVDVL